MKLLSQFLHDAVGVETLGGIFISGEAAEGWRYGSGQPRIVVYSTITEAVFPALIFAEPVIPR